jgi:PII-like signaling protein
MTLRGSGKLLRIFIGESDKWRHKPLYEEIVRLARDRGLAGATVLRGIEGFGRSSHVHTARILRLSEDLPLVVEIVDTAEKIDAFLEEVDDMIEGGMVTLDDVEVRTYRSPEEKGS